MNTSQQVQQAIELFEQQGNWEQSIMARSHLIETWTKNKTILELPETAAYVEASVTLGRQMLSPQPTLLHLIKVAFHFYILLNAPSKALQKAKAQLEVAEQLQPTDYKQMAQATEAFMNVYYQMGDFAKSIEYAYKCSAHYKAAGSLTDLAGTYSSLGVLYDANGQYKEGLEMNQKALSLALELGDKMAPNDLLTVYNNMATSYSKQGEHDKAILYQQKALTTAQQVWGKDGHITAMIQRNVGITYLELKQFDKALPYLEATLATHEKTLPALHPELAYSYFAIGIYYYGIKDLDLALHYFKKMLNVSLSNHGEAHPQTIKAYRNMAKILVLQKQHEEALSILQQCEQNIEQLWSKTDDNIARFYIDIIRCYVQIPKHTGKALEYVYKLEEFATHQMNTHEWSYQNLSSYPFFLYAQQFKGQVYYQHYQEQTQAIEDITTAVQAYEKALSILDKVRHSFQTDGAKLHLNAFNATFFENGLKAALELNHFTGNAPSTAFRFLEKSKASLLMESMQAGVAKAASTIPHTFLKKEKELKIHLTALEKRIQILQVKTEKNKQNTGIAPPVTHDLNHGLRVELQATQNDFFETHQQYTLLIEQFEADYPDYYQLKYATKTAVIQDLQAHINENQALLNYFVGAELIYIFVITEEEFEVIEIQKPNNFEPLITDFLKAINHHHQEQYIELAYELYQLLIAPVEVYWQNPLAGLLENSADDIPQLVIIPHAELTYLPFEALLKSPNIPSSVPVSTLKQNEYASDSLENSYQHLDYLLHHCEISYHYSATLWLYQQQKGSLHYNNEHSFAGIAPVYDTVPTAVNISNNNTYQALKVSAESCRSWATRSEALRSDGTFVSLPHSETEVKGIAQLFKKNGLEAATYLREQATKKGFAKAAKGAKYLLVAAHGLVNDEQTVLSGLVFYPEEPSPAPKGELKSKTVEGKERQLSNNQTLTQSNNIDAILSMEETYHLGIEADLVVLSSCESGIGKLVKGEGMMAINRGFLYAGAKNVISTLFKVYDKPSSLLTQYFFEAILEGDSYAGALRKAKLKLMDTEGINPKSWCGFVLFGQ